MYEQVRSRMAAEIYGKMDQEQVGMILAALDKIMADYEITERSTAIIPYGDELPELAKIYLASRGV